VSVANKLPSVWEIIACVQPNKVGKIDRRMEKSEKGGGCGGKWAENNAQESTTNHEFVKAHQQAGNT